MQHVDVVKNEWLAGFQLVVGRLDLHNGHLEPQWSDDSWADVVMRPHRKPATGEEITPADEQTFFESLHEVVRGDYLFATEPHDEQECPFAQMVVPLRSIEGGLPTAAASGR